MEWRWDPDPADDTYIVDYAFLLRGANGLVRALHDRHVEGLFARARWLEWFASGWPLGPEQRYRSVGKGRLPRQGRGLSLTSSVRGPVSGEAGAQLLAIDQVASQVDARDSSRVGDVVQRVGIEHDEIGALARCHGAQIVLPEDGR